MAEAIHDAQRLLELQALPLERKIQITQTRIIEWHNHYHGNVCVSFSGGKDSTVLLHIARQIYPDIPAVFSNTGLEYPEIQRFVKSFDNVDIVTPKMRFDEVLSTYGYPLIGKEVAEAIYYARRLRSQTVNVERERESRTSIEQYKRTELFGERTTRYSRPESSSWGNDGSTHTHGGERNSADKSHTSQPNRLAQNRTQGGETSVKEQSRGTSNQSSRGSETFWKRTEITGQYPGERNTAGVVDGKSQFNKEKWLPLAYTPFLITHMCCHKTKKQPLHEYQNKNKYAPILATLAEESRVRKQGWIRTGCNAFDSKNPKSQPLSFWTEQDILAYIVKYGLEIASVYGDIISVDESGNEYPPIDVLGNVGCNLRCTGCDRTGCVFCAFGFHLEKGETRFQRLAKTHPKQYEYAIGGGQWSDNPFYDPVASEYDGEWKNWNPKKIWTPSKKGLGMGKVFDMANEIYGKDFYRYD